jgi:hypothetical protein
MTATLWNDAGYDHEEELSFELREMLTMLDRLEGDLSDAATNEYGDDMEIGVIF